MLMLLAFKGYGLTHEQKIVALTILGEARGEGKAGMYAVACVIEQRSWNRKLALSKVCVEKEQFSRWNKRGHQDWILQHDNLLWTPQAPYALSLAMKMIDGSERGKQGLKLSWIKNAVHYCNVNINNYWTRGRKPVAIIGRHKFYKLR